MLVQDRAESRIGVGAYLLNAEGRTARSGFVASVSHELRTPMTSVSGYVELLLDPAPGP